MLTLDREETASAVDYGVLNSSIKETFAAIDRFESQAVDEILVMRDQQVFKSAGYNNFSEYCTGELYAWGGYRRINQLLGAHKVIEAAGEFGGHIKNERQARPLVRLAKEPEKLKAAVALALEENPSPSESDFAAAAKKVVTPTPRKKHSAEEPLVPQSHPEYTEVIASLREQHKQELEQLEQELRIGLQTEATATAEEQVQEQLSSLQHLLKQHKEQNVQLQQRLDEMEGLRKLEIENQQLQRRIQELEHAVQERPAQQWGNTMTAQATKALNKQIKLALEKTIDLRSLAVEPPKENATECLRLLGMALKQIATAMNNTQAMEAAAIILGSSPTPSAIALRAEQLQLLPHAVSDIRRVLLKPGCTWRDYWAVAQEYEVIKSDYWAELTPQETELITALEKAKSSKITEQTVSHESLVASDSSNCDLRSGSESASVIATCELIEVGSIVAHADPYRTLYVERGEVVEDLGDEVIVAWEHWKEQLKKTDRYCKDELRFWQSESHE
ncbi:MAG: hypothetical protein KME40_34775 [Komarekiella atlantica HA4396-MV6]|jgi:hypothetical protein|nr:hypothetical protein [Komarekiella atlantica HA4396-MV6]